MCIFPLDTKTHINAVLAIVHIARNDVHSHNIPRIKQAKLLLIIFKKYLQMKQRIFSANVPGF